MDFYFASKLFWLVAAPATVLVVLAIIAAALLAIGRPRAARVVAIGAAAGFAVLGLLPSGKWLIKPLEDEYPRPDPPPAHVDGVVTLGGGLDAATMAARGALTLEPTLSRVVETYALARRYPGARVVFSGGGTPMPEAIAAKRIFDELGLPAGRLTLETRSRNTFENLLFTRDLVHPRAGEHWVLATSAYQMPRAMAVAERLGWTMIPWPTDYITGRRLASPFEELDVGDNLRRVNIAVKEWIGLAVYRLEGMAAPAKA